MIRTIAVRLSDIGARLRTTILLEEVRKRTDVIERPDFKVDEAMRDLSKAASALESIKVYAVGRPLDWHEEELWRDTPDFRDRIAGDLAAKIGAGLLNAGAIRISLVDTDKPGVKAALAEVAVVTAESDVFSKDIATAFRAGVDGLKRQLIDYIAHRMPRMRSQDELQHIARVIDNMKPEQIQAPAMMRREWFDTGKGAMKLEDELNAAADRHQRYGENMLEYLRARGFDLVQR